MAQLEFKSARYDWNGIDTKAVGTAVVSIPEDELPYVTATVRELQGETIKITYYVDPNNIYFKGSIDGAVYWIWRQEELQDISLTIPKETIEEE